MIFFLVLPLTHVIVAFGLGEGVDINCEGVPDGDGEGEGVEEGDGEGVGTTLGIGT